MRKAPLLAVVTLALVVAGCDTTAFSEEYPDPGTHGMPPSVSFSHGNLETAGFEHDRNQPELGSYRSATSGTTITLPVRLTSALGEDVTVNFSLGGDAREGVDYEVLVQDWFLDSDGRPEVDEDGQVIRDANAYIPPEAPGEFIIYYVIEDEQTYYRQFRINILDDAEAGRELVVSLTGASSANWPEITAGRLPANRDRVLTIWIE